MRLLTIDWLITIGLVGGLVWAGLYGRKLVRSVAQFTVAGRGMGMWLGISTGQAEAMGLICIATGVQNGFIAGFSWIWVAIVMTLIGIVPFGIYGLGIMRYRATNVQTLPQYFEIRYSRGVRIFSGMSLGIGGVLNMAIFPIVESHFIIAFLGLPATVGVLGLSVPTFPLVLFGILVMAMFFTAIGGMVSVTITEYIQAALMTFSLTIITVLIIYKAGLSNMTHALETNLGSAGFNPFAKHSLGIAFILAMLIGSFVNKLSFPPALQKFSSAIDPKVARLQLLWSSLFGQGRSIMFVVWGIAALAIMGPHIPVGQDPEHYQRVLGGIMIRQVTPPVLMGITLASFIFASISTVNVYLLTWASVIANDVVCAIRSRPYTPEKHVQVLRLTCVCVAASIFLWGLYYKPSEHILQWFVITGAIFGGSGLIAWFGLYWRRATTAGAWGALTMAVAIPVGWILFKQHLVRLLGGHGFADTYLTQDNVGLFAAVFPAVVLVIISLIPGQKSHFVDFGVRLREVLERDKKLADSPTEETADVEI